MVLGTDMFPADTIDQLTTGVDLEPGDVSQGVKRKASDAPEGAVE